mmetsp:Transcript_96648/g.144699  ORF Transcript_96648/g.144699 Transcript_96648/m.144699 type:complete len:103 (+) Transcript_96648:1578-1886(+)
MTFFFRLFLLLRASDDDVSDLDDASLVLVRRDAEFFDELFELTPDKESPPLSGLTPTSLGTFGSSNTSRGKSLPFLRSAPNSSFCLDVDDLCDLLLRRDADF